MKISVLVAQYLYDHHLLELPGLGVFKVENDSKSTTDHHSSKEAESRNITFQGKKITQLSPELIEYIRLKTGKLRPLAEADVVSYLEDAKAFLNLGKPFHLEGIGTLLYLNDGKLQFTMGAPILEKIESKSINTIEEKAKDYSKAQPVQIPVKAILFGFIGIITLAAVWWLVGLFMKAKNTPSEVTQTPVVEQVQIVDTAALRRDSIALALAKENEGKYKFVMEVTDRKTRALRRFAQVNELNPRIKMETGDSVTYKIFVVLPATERDTTRIKDSLNAWYYGTLPNKIKVEKP
ncbi:hypothetical protein [Gynurincola endophyticus]|uniref:hypothetical protein n=1 Tax=Gynurincola endophyticus TaxID=2479004 RepID=UPI000F8D54B5|nr:hypothetical protein [Gynurincola endophyticus]